MFDDLEVVAFAKQVMEHEAFSISEASSRLSAKFVLACRTILHSRGRVAVLGVGKSGLVGRKIASTLSSTGTPAFFLHAAEAGHGDLGMITCDDVVLALSNSGETEETCNVAPLLRRFGAKLIALTGNERSTLAQCADIHIDAAVIREACPLNLAPTASTAVQLAIGDAIAMVLLKLRGFSDNDFAKTHPGGALGRALYLRVSEVMSKEEAIQCMGLDEPLMTLVGAMSAGLGAVLIVDDPTRKLGLKGIFTDSDLRRLVRNIGGTASPLKELFAKDVMSGTPFYVPVDCLASEALRLMEQKNISRLPVLKGDTVVGIVSLHNLLGAKLL